MNYDELSPKQLVNLLGDKQIRNDVILALLGGITATDMKNISVSVDVKQALFDGLKHTNPSIRWWCIQLMDHLADESYVQVLIDVAYNDPSPKNRRHAIHALTCEACKPDGCMLRVNLTTVLGTIIETDSDWSVKMMALDELQEHATLETVSDVVDNLSGSQQIQIKCLHQTQKIQQDLGTLLSYAKQLQGWRGRAIYELFKAIEKLLQAGFAILIDNQTQSITHKLQHGFDHMNQAVDEVNQNQSDINKLGLQTLVK
jgi:hypothetical protein